MHSTPDPTATTPTSTWHCNRQGYASTEHPTAPPPSSTWKPPDQTDAESLTSPPTRRTDMNHRVGRERHHTREEAKGASVATFPRRDLPAPGAVRHTTPPGAYSRKRFPLGTAGDAKKAVRSAERLVCQPREEL